MPTATFTPEPYAKRVLRASFWTIVPALCAIVAGIWLSRGHPEQAIARAALLAAAMTAVHVFGYRLYQRQPIAWSPRYAPAARSALLFQVLILLFASILLDGGFLFRGFAWGSLGTWLGTALIVCRRPESPTMDDLAFIRFASFPLAGIATFLMLTMPRITAQF